MTGTRHHVWYLVVDKAGHHHARAEGWRLKAGEVVLGPPYLYRRCCEEADRLNAVAEVMTS